MEGARRCHRPCLEAVELRRRHASVIAKMGTRRINMLRYESSPSIPALWVQQSLADSKRQPRRAIRLHCDAREVQRAIYIGGVDHIPLSSPVGSGSPQQPPSPTSKDPRFGE
jgi:hypothetical protein